MKTITKKLKFKLKQDREKKFMADLKRIYKANNKELAAEELDILAATWNDSYPIVIKSWRSNWERLSRYFKYPEDIRRIIYTAKYH